MKKTLLALLLLAMLLTVSTASAKKYTPDDDIGLFIDKELFRQCITQSELGSPIMDYACGPTIDPETSEAFDWEAYLLKNGAKIMNLLDFNSTKITMASIKFPKGYSKTDDMVHAIIEGVLKCTGLVFDEYDTVVSTIREIGMYENFSYFLYVDTDSITNEVIVKIYSFYWAENETPYGIMDYYEYLGNNCDSNYIGACVPVTDKDLECRDINIRNFFVVGEDKHNFDGDGNGVCCEPYADAY